jgi:hypothetical protein
MVYWEYRIFSELTGEKLEFVEAPRIPAFAGILEYARFSTDTYAC